MLKKSREIMYAESDDTKTFSMHNPPLTANNIDMLSPIAKLAQEAQNESNRYCEKNRRSRQSRHTKRDSPNAPDQDGRPLAENIDTGICVLLRDAGDCGERVHRMNTPVRCIAAICACKVKKFFLSCLHYSLNSKAAALY